MNIVSAWRMLNGQQKNAFLAAFLGWALDAFDYFLLIFVIEDIARAFHAGMTAVVFSTTLTLAMRPVGALIFGLAGDRYGRRIPLTINVLVYSAIELLTGFSPTLSVFLLLRALFGVGMGGEWGLGASLALESAPAECRGALSGALQEGYPVGYLLAALTYWIAYPLVGWRGLFFIGAAPALLSVFIMAKVKESPIWLARTAGAADQAARAQRSAMWSQARSHAGLFGYLVLLMAAFNFMSHGTQDTYPTFLLLQHRFSHSLVGAIAVFYNIGAIIGGVFFGTLSERIGRRRAITIASLVALPIIPLWAFSQTAGLLAAGAFLMQVMVQGAWGVIPAHLSEIAPADLRGTFTGFAYQCGNLIASINLPLQTMLAARLGGDSKIGEAMAIVVATALAATVLLTAIGREKRGADLSIAA